ncbi:MAG TPA: hypothetical protein VGP08_19280 [Pyrinomonadaceae bacterium]|jgi:hypothetical protein|nr:hypothetical protein [Pyrinomonadaceae bacterium]
MSSTEVREEERDARKDRLAADFFREVLVPVALKEHESGREFFALRPDASAESYYVEPTKREMRPEDFELRAGESIKEFVRELAALWASEGREELAAMAPRLAALAREVREDEEQSDDVSPFMYVMF